MFLVLVLSVFRCGASYADPFLYITNSDSCRPAGNGSTLRVSFQRHAYELGEHYNSLVPGTPQAREKPVP